MDSRPKSRAQSYRWTTPMSTSATHNALPPNPTRNQRDRSESPGGQTEGGGSVKYTRACTRCKSHKIKCEFTPDDAVCIRCRAGGYECIPRQRSVRKPAPPHEVLLHESDQKSRTIETLMLELDLKTKERKILQSLRRTGSTPRNTEQHPGYANPRSPHISSAGKAAEAAVSTYFGKGPTACPPDIVKFCELCPQEIIDLFTLFFDKVNIYFSILNPVKHNPQRLIWESPFLFSVICAIASRFYGRRPQIYSAAMECAKHEAGTALIHGSMDVDVCQAYLLLAIYAKPKKNWAEDKSWEYIGIAVRLMIQLKINQRPRSGMNELEQLNRTRTWLICFYVDLSHATLCGKMPSVPVNDYLAHHSRDWYRSSPSNLPMDIHLCARVEMFLIMSEFQAEVKQRQERDVEALVAHYDDKLAKTIEYWIETFARYTNPSDPVSAYRSSTTQMIAAYLRLVVLSVRFHQVAKRGINRNDVIIQKSIRIARSIIQTMIQELYPMGGLRYDIESNFLYVAFAAAFLINLLRPKYLPIFDEHRRQSEIITLLRQLIGVLGHRDVAIDETHTPALYARFLSSLIPQHDPMASTAHSRTSQPSFGMGPSFPQDQNEAWSDFLFWPHISTNVQEMLPDANLIPPEFLFYQQRPVSATGHSGQYHPNPILDQYAPFRGRGPPG